MWAAFTFSPWPSALIVRGMFDREGVKVGEALAPHVPSPAPSEVLDVPYRAGDDDATLDIFRPAAAGDAALPTLVWVHGGAWISGDKEQIANYLRIIADRGYTVVGINYSLAPGATYPTPVIQTMAALEFLSENAATYGVDPERFVLAGDSAGSQIAAQVAAITVTPDYGDLVGVAPALAPTQLRATVLTCGAYDTALAGVEGGFAGFLKTVLWSYTGTRDFAEDPALKSASVVNYVTGAFPPSFITAGNDDPLLPQSEKFAERLTAEGVDTTTLFYPKDFAPALGHEYQFDLDTEAGRGALEQIVSFLDEHTR